MNNIEHPDITHVNRTGYTREEWRELNHGSDHDDEHDRSEWDDRK